MTAGGDKIPDPPTGSSPAGSPQLSHALSDPGLEIWLADLGALRAPLAALDAQQPILAGEERLSAADAGSASAPPSPAGDRITARLALRLLIERHFGSQYRQVPFVRGPRGKPGLEGLAGDFSLSHANGFALIGLGRVVRLGLDLEFPRAVHLSEPRRAAIESAAQALAPKVPLPADAPRRFLQAWTRIEAVAKATGLGMGRTLAALEVWGGGARLDEMAAARTAIGALAVVDLVPGLEAAMGGIAALAMPVDTGPLAGVQCLPADPARLTALRAGAAIVGNSGVDLAPAPPHKGPVRSVAQPG